MKLLYFLPLLAALSMLAAGNVIPVVPSPSEVVGYGNAAGGAIAQGNMTRAAAGMERSSDISVKFPSPGRIDFAFGDESQKSWWFSKGVKITLRNPIGWDEFEGIALDFKVSHPAACLTLSLLDDRGYWWECFLDKVNAEIPSAAVFEKQTVRRSPMTTETDFVPHEMSGKIVAVYPAFTIWYANKNQTYEASFENIRFIRKFPAGRFPYETVEKFPMQWKNDNMRPDGTILADGQPFFPLMLYSCSGIDPASAWHQAAEYRGPVDEAALKARFRRIADAGFNVYFSYTLQYYGLENAKPGWSDGAVVPKGKTRGDLYREGAKKWLDWCEEFGMKGMLGGSVGPYVVNGPLPQKARAEAWAGIKAEMGKTIPALRDHPGLLVWYMIDEPSVSNIPPAELLQAYQFGKKLDAKHPFFMAASHTPNDPRYFKAVDLFGPDSYPLAGNLPIGSDSVNRRRWCDSARVRGFPFPWDVILIGYWAPTPQKSEPTAEQIRAMAFSSLTDDLKGLSFYLDHNYEEKNPQHWNDIARVIKSLRNATDYVLRSRKIDPSVKADSGRIRFIVHELEGRLLILAVNLEEIFDPDLSPRKAPVPVDLGRISFTLPGRSIEKIEVLDESEDGVLAPGKIRAIAADSANSFSDRFGKYAAHAYLVTLKDGK